MLSRFLPAWSWLQNYNPALLSADLVAAIVVTIMLIPQSLAYAMLAGVPAEMGLYASILPLIAYALFGTSRTLSVGPVAIVSLMTATAIGQFAEPGSAVLLDCLTLWLSNLLHAGRDVDTQSQLLLESLATLKGPVVIVSNEVGLGVTPNNALSRRYLDHLGQLHQQIAAQAARVYFLVAGIATLIKHT